MGHSTIAQEIFLQLLSSACVAINYKVLTHYFYYTLGHLLCQMIATIAAWGGMG